MDFAARPPAAMARITVAVPVTMSPPAKTPLREVRWVTGAPLPSGVDAMLLREHIAMKGVKFPAPLIMLSR